MLIYLVGGTAWALEFVSLFLIVAKYTLYKTYHLNYFEYTIQ